MKRIALLLCLLSSACATARVTQPWPDFEPAPRTLSPQQSRDLRQRMVEQDPITLSSASSPASAVRRMALGRLPPMKLREMVLGASIDFLAHGSTPSGAGDVFCGTSTTAAAFQSPAACGLATGTNYWTLSGGILSPTGITAPQDIEMATTSSSTTTPAKFGWTGMGASQAVRLLFGDANSGIQNGNGDPLQIFAYHAIEIWGGEQGTVPPFSSSTADRASLDVIGESGASGGPALMISKNVSGTITHGTAISYSGRGTLAVSAVSCAASTCTSLGNVTKTGASTGTFPGAIVGAECVTSHTTTAGAIGTNGTALGIECGVTGADTVTLYCCNHTAGALSLTGTYSARVFNP